MRKVCFSGNLYSRNIRRINPDIKVPPPTPINKNVYKFYFNGLSKESHGNVHGCFDNPKFKNYMSEIFDLTYKDIGLFIPRNKPEMPSYQIFSVKEIDKINKKINDFLENLKFSLKVYNLRKPNISEILHVEPTLMNFSDAKYVFVDISPSKNKLNRPILVRQPTGALEVADWEIRERMEVVFYGIKGQHYPYPSFTISKNIRNLSSREIFNALCYITYYLPSDSPLYQNAVGECFETICDKNGFAVMASSHFYILFIYHCLAFSNARLQYLVKNIMDRNRKAIPLLAKAFAMVNSTTETAKMVTENKIDEEISKAFLDEVEVIYKKYREELLTQQFTNPSPESENDEIDKNFIEPDEFEDINASEP